MNKLKILLIYISSNRVVVLQVWAYTLFRKWQLTYLSRWSLKTIHTVEQP